MKVSPVFLILVATAATAAAALAGGGGWMTDFEKARRQAAAEGKDLLVDFTGSDWCGFCIQLSEEVFSQAAFAAQAPGHFVLVEIDFPREAPGLSEATIAQNVALADRYRVREYPTIILMDATGRPYARTGYRPGGVDAYLAHLEELRRVRLARDEHLKLAAGQEGVARARTLARALEGLPREDVDWFYADLVGQITTADPEDQSGFRKARAYREALTAFTREMEGLLGQGKIDEADRAITGFLREHNPAGEDLQEVLMGRVMVHMERRDAAAALAQLDRIKAINPDSETGRQVESFKEGIASYLSQEGSPEEGSSE